MSRSNGQPGVNVAGYVAGSFGLAHGVRASIKALESVGIPFAINEFRLPGTAVIDNPYLRRVTTESPYRVNLIHVNPDYFENLLGAFGKDYFRNRYNIGFWAWETPKF